MRLRLFSLLIVLVLGASAGLSAAPKSSRRKEKATVSIREARTRKSTTREKRKRTESRTETTREKSSTRRKKRSEGDERTTAARTSAKKSEKKSAKTTDVKKADKSGKKATDAAAAKKPTAPKALTGAKKPAATPTVADSKPQAASTTATPATLAGADEAYGQKSYAKALRGYRQALNRKQVPANRAAQVDYRIARCLEHTKDWNNATASMQGVSAKYPNSPWDARAKGALMLLYLRVPHNAWKVGDRFYRGEMPKTDDAAQPVRVDLTTEDQRKAVTNGEQAKALWEKLRARTGFEREEADHDADLARVVSGLQMSPWADAGKWAAPSDPQWNIDTAAAYDPAWATPKKVVYLFTHAEQTGNDTQKPLARLALAHWLRGYHSAMEYAALEDPSKGDAKVKPYPYQDLSARKTLETLIADFPNHPESEHARLTLADWLNTDGKFAEALAAYEAFQKEFPKSQWLGNAKAAAAEITRLVLSIDPPQPQAPGKKAKLSLDARNIKTLKLTAYRVRLEELIKDTRVLNRPGVAISDIFALLGSTKGIRKFYQPDPVIWESTLDEKGDHVPYQGEIETPLTRNGAYVIEANGGPVRQSVALLITDLAVVQLSEAGKTHAFVVNAATGAPVFEASALIREVYRDAKDNLKISAVTRTTDADGLAEKLYAPVAQYSENVSILAWKGDRYAITSGASGSPAASSTREQTAYLYSDRPVYRPGQKMQFRALLAQRNEEGVWRPLSGQKVKLQITDPKGAVVFTDSLESGAKGTLHGDYTFDSQPPLGMYAMGVSWENEDKTAGAGAYNFRVEEYKKPEFEVTVAPSSTGVARIGEPLKAKIKARYYFGAPVAKAKVSYKVTRSEFFPQDPFPIPFAQLYAAKHPTDQARWWDPNWIPFPEGEVASGTVTTDENGEAEITIDTALKDPRVKDRHVEFAIHAEVTDASRRTIEGNGTARALARQFDAFARVRAGFYSPGDRLQADIRTLDANGKPVAVAGSVRVLRLTAVQRPTSQTPPDLSDQTPEEKYTEEEVAREPLRTNDEGRAVFAWTANAPGHYEIRFEARDAWESLVVGRARAWVSGDAAAAGVFHNKHVQVIAQQDNYRIGDTAKVLIVTDEPGMTVLLTHEAGDRLLSKSVVRLKDRSTVLEIPLTQAQSPDITIAVTGVRDRQLFRSTAQLYVPPAEQLLDVSVKADKADYEPGQKATLTLQARDHAGKGVVTSVSVGVADASVYYIQGETAPPIQRSFYGGERNSHVSPLGSLSQQFDIASEDEQPPLKETGRYWKFPEGLGSLLFGDEFGSGFTGEARLEGRSYYLQSATLNGAPAAAMPAQLSGAGGMGGDFMTRMAAKAAPEGHPVMVTLPPARPSTRSLFADTAFWAPEVETDASGKATVTVTWPDNLTTWRATVRGWSDTAQVGEGTTDVTTSKDLLVRLQAPRFFMERDEVVLSANVHNYTDRARKVDVRLELDGQILMPAGTGPVDAPMPRKLDVPRADKPAPDKAITTTGAASAAPLSDPELAKSIEVPVNGETRVDWRVRVDRAGMAKIRVLAEGSGSDDDVADAVELSFPAYTHGIEKLVSKSGSLLGEAKSAKVSVDLPAERAPSSGELIVQVSPTLAATMLDALPYLVDYPYGCTEQTLSRFVPAAITSKTLTDLGLDLGDLKKRADLEYQRLKDDAPKSRPTGDAFSYPEGSPGRRDVQRLMLARAQWASEKSPVYQPAVLKAMTAEGMARLARFQNKDGGWGWWQNDTSTERMTAYVVQGLLTARKADIAVPAWMIERGMKWLDGHFKKTNHAHDSVLVGYVLTLDPKRAPGVAASLLERSFRGRDRLTAYSLALLTMALKNGGKTAEAKICLDNLENTAKIDAEASTCYWPKNDGGYWNWYNDDLETAAAALRAYLALSPKHRLVGPTVRWIAGNRDGLAWSSTRGTALAIEALAEYVTLNKELQPDQKVTVEIAGGFKRTFALNPEEALFGDHRLVVPAEALGQGPQSITLTREGSGNLYYNAYLRYYSLEEGIPAAGSDLKIRRRFFKLTKPVEPPAKGAPVTADGYLRTPIRTGERLTSGDLLDVELTIEAKNSYDYLVFEDMKPAGCEPVELRSGARYGGDRCSNMELRDEKVSFFVTWFPQGRRQITYRVRAEIPGMFHALPTNGYAMYAPELRAISDESQFGIQDAP